MIYDAVTPVESEVVLMACTIVLTEALAFNGSVRTPTGPRTSIVQLAVTTEVGYCKTPFCADVVTEMFTGKYGMVPN